MVAKYRAGPDIDDDEHPYSIDFEFLLELPPEVTLSTSCMVRCRGRVVRTDDASSKLTGIAARILDYSIEQEEALSA